ncbi:AAA family ATPase [Paraburkholderia diazotrophica]|uniref:AAA family ATPase n=1 Tax=Paraburkholderia diazotrophica TaxID=667676 RepID=UPI003D166282
MLAKRSAKIKDVLLREARESGRRGVNTLIYGPPGTGKSELARVLARDLGCELFEIASEDADGEPIDPLACTVPTPRASACRVGISRITV